MTDKVIMRYKNGLMPNNLLNVCLFVLKLDTNGLLTHFVAAAVANNKINMERKIKN